MFNSQVNSWRSISNHVLFFAALFAGVSTYDLAAQTLFSVGAANSASGLELSDVTAATTLPDGHVIVLDAMDRALYLVSPDGRRVRKSGRIGSGPGEFRSPSRVAVDMSGRVIVFDPPLRRFSWFTVSGDSLLFERSTNIGEGGRDFCIISDRLYMLGRNGLPISVYKVTASSLVLTDSMGLSNLQHPLAANPMVRSYGQAGSIGCGLQAKQILWHSSQLDAGQVISLNGSQSPLRLPEFLEVVMTPIKNGIMNSMRKEGAVELVTDIVPVDASDYFVVSVLQRARNPKSEYRVRQIHSDGRASLPTTVSARLHSYKAGVAVCEPVSDVPQLFVVRNSPSPARYPCDNSVLKTSL